MFNIHESATSFTGTEAVEVLQLRLPVQKMNGTATSQNPGCLK